MIVAASNFFFYLSKGSYVSELWLLACKFVLFCACSCIGSELNVLWFSNKVSENVMKLYSLYMFADAGDNLTSIVNRGRSQNT